MTRFERSIVNAFNDYFDEDGIAYRLKQHRFTSQILDVIVDNPYLGIECKSIKTDSTNKLYFSQHFSQVDGENQVERITEFLKKSGRKGFLAVELKRGTGRSRKAYLIEWNAIAERFNSENAGIPVELVKESSQSIEIERINQEYVLNEEIIEKLEEEKPL